MDELNKKLAEWRWGKDKVETYPRVSDSKLISFYQTGRWIDDDKEWEIAVAPDFPNDLNACFKWLTSKAIEDYGLQVICGAISNALFHSYMSKTNDVATRFCRDIEKLIDGGD